MRSLFRGKHPRLQGGTHIANAFVTTAGRRARSWSDEAVNNV
jgi:hypothetical protein